MSITSIIAGAGLEGGGGDGDITIGIAARSVAPSMLTANMPASILGSGQVVKSLNSLEDSVILAQGSHLTITPTGQILTFDVPIIGFTALNATLPLILTTPDDGVTIDGSIAITPANDGGAVALQTAGSPTFQTGYAALDGLYLPNNGFITMGFTTVNPGAYFFLQNDTDNPTDYLLFEDNAGDPIFGVTKAGVTDIASAAITVGTVTTTLTFGASKIILDPDTTTYFGVPVSMDGVWTLAAAGQFVADNAALSIFELNASSTTNPLINVSSTTAGGNVLLVKDNSDTPVTTCSLDTDGNFFATRVKTDQFTVVAVEKAAGGYTLDFTSPSVYACNAVSAPITFTLPELTSDSPSGLTFTFKKVDVSTNGVMVSTSGGQAIDGVMSKTISTQWQSLKIASVVNGSTTYWVIL